MILPKGFQRSIEEDYWHLKEHVQLWDVACQRQVELKGPDAAHLAQLMTPRDLGNARTGQCLYAPMVDDNGRMLNDPVILKLAEDHFWFSIADLDMLLWAKGLATGLGLDVSIDEPDVSPLAVQGPKADDLMEAVFGAAAREIGFFRFRKLDFLGEPLIVARSGYSKQGGFEIYLDDSSKGEKLWDALWKSGQQFNVSPGCPNLIERIEGGLISYGNEMTRENNPLECGLEKYCQLDGSIDYIGREALERVNQRGPERMIRGVIFEGEPCPPCRQPWPVLVDNKKAGQITSAIWSPRFKANVSLGMIDMHYWDANQKVEVHSDTGTTWQGSVCYLPM
jgi:dimethylsulfoniopropionate demethylase